MQHSPGPPRCSAISGPGPGRFDHPRRSCSRLGELASCVVFAADILARLETCRTGVGDGLRRQFCVCTDPRQALDRRCGSKADAHRSDHDLRKIVVHILQWTLNEVALQEVGTR